MTIEASSIPEELLTLASLDGRVVPNPRVWNSLWKALSGKIQKPDGSWEPSLPLILDGWWYSNDAQKRARFLEHLGWAVNHGQADEMIRILGELKSEDWYYGEG